MLYRSERRSMLSVTASCRRRMPGNRDYFPRALCAVLAASTGGNSSGMSCGGSRAQESILSSAAEAPSRASPKYLVGKLPSFARVLSCGSFGVGSCRNVPRYDPLVTPPACPLVIGLPCGDPPQTGSLRGSPALRSSGSFPRRDLVKTKTRALP